MAKVHIPPNATFSEIAEELKKLGITVDPNQLPDGTYRVYVRKDHMQHFLAATGTRL